MISSRLLEGDAAVLRQLVDLGQASPTLFSAARWLTELGGAPVLWAFTLAASFWLWRRGAPRSAGLLLATAGGGRLTVEVLKAWTARPRPDLIEHSVFTHALSLPSGHAANATIVYLTAALLVAPAARRTQAVVAAVLLALPIGLTRPVLGVHWPSDVLAGWLWGAGWTLLCVGLAQRWLEGERARPPSASSLGP